MEKEKYPLATVLEKCALRQHPAVYLCPSTPSERNNLYFVCEESGNVLFVTFGNDLWEEPTDIHYPKLNIDGLEQLTKKKAVQFSTAP